MKRPSLPFENGQMFGMVADQPVVILDFETTGMSPARGDRAIELGAVLVEGGCVVARFQSLINPGMAVSPFIQDLTGINNSMLCAAPDGDVVMAQFSEFMGGYPLLAHNAPFDGRFLDAELARIGRVRANSLYCTLRISRCLYPHIRSHKLSSMINYKRLPLTGTLHRALADAEMTARLWLAMLEDLRLLHGRELSWNDVQGLRPLSRYRAQTLFP